MKITKKEKLRGFRKLSLLLAFVLAFSRIPQAGMLTAYAEPAEESVSGETVNPVSKNAGTDDAKTVSGQEEEASGTVSGQDEETTSGNTVSNDASEAEPEEAAGGSQEIEVDTWAKLREALKTNGNKIRLTADITASDGDICNEHGGIDKEKILKIPAGVSVTLDLRRHIIDRNTLGIEQSGDMCFVIWVDGGELTLMDSDDGTDNPNPGKITGGDAQNGGGVYVTNGGTFTMNSGHIGENFAKNGGGVAVLSGNFIMRGGKITGNKASKDGNAYGYGGGVYVDSDAGDSSFNMVEGGICTNLSESDGGGVYVSGKNKHKALFTMTEGNATIDHNEVVDGDGDGGGVYITSESSGKSYFTMSGGSINNNKAKNGGGIYSRTYGENTETRVNMTGGTIEQNKADVCGGGVAVRNSGFTIYGGKIFDNHAGKKDESNGWGYGGGVYVFGKGGGASLSMNGGEINKNTATRDGGGVFITTESSGNAGFTMKKGDITENEAGSCGGGIYTQTDGEGCNTRTYMTDGNIVNNKAKNGGGLYIFNSRFTMGGGRITKNSADTVIYKGNASEGRGGGVAVSGKAGGAAFIMNGGKISDNTARLGGGVSVRAHTNGNTHGKTGFDLTGGSIADNKATEDGGGVNIESGRDTGTKDKVAEAVLNMTGGDITGNEAAGNGGGIRSIVGSSTWTKLYLQGGTIENNKAKNGGGLYTGWNISQLKGTSIQGNSASRNGGGVYIDGGKCTVSGGSIINNTAAVNGGGIYLRYDEASAFNLSESPKIKDNTESSPAVHGNVCLANYRAEEKIFKINIAGKFTPSKALGFKVINDNTGALRSAVITSGLKNSGTLSSAFAAEGEGASLSLDADGELIYNIPCQHTQTELRYVRPAYCKEKGYSGDVYCKNCEALIEKGHDTDFDPDNHKYDAGVITKEPTKYTMGETTYTCTLCSHKITVADVPCIEKDTYTVTFKDGDKEFASQEVLEGETAREPSEKPSKEGSDFLGWAKGTSLWNFSTPVHSSMTLTAKYVSTSPAAVSENTGSGMDPVAKIEATDKGKVIYLVKGQSYTAGTSGWSIKSGGGISVAPNTGKITANKRGHYLVEHDGEVITVKVAAPQFEKNYKTRTVMVGRTGWIQLNVNPEEKDELENFPVTWAVANPAVATVNNGTITGLAKGSTSIYAYCGGKTYTSKLTVNDTFKAPGTFTYNTPQLEMNPLQSVNLKFKSTVFTVNGAKWDGDGLEATKNKSGKADGGYKNNIITITKAGKITAIGKGKTTIHGVDSKNREAWVTVTVTNIPTCENTYVNKNKQTTIKFAFVKNNAAKWETSNTAVIPSVTNGKIRGTAVGSSNIGCTYKDFKFNTLVYVEDPEFNTDDKLKLDKNKYVMTLKEGSVYNRVTMKNVFQTTVYKSSKPAVAFIDENGVIYARSKGKTNISTKINGKTFKIALTVE